MSRRILSCAFAACLAASPYARGEEAIRLEPVREDGGRVRLRVEAPGLPAGAVLAVRLERVVPTPTRRTPAVLLSRLLSLSRDGYGEASYQLAGAFAVPGRYRFSVAFDPKSQRPEVLASAGRASPASVQAVLEDDVASKTYLEAVLKEQAFLAVSLEVLGRILDRLNELEALVRKDRAQGVAAWEAWHPAAVREMEGIIAHGRSSRDAFYPETYELVSERFVFAGLFQMESRKFGGAKAGTDYYHATGSFKDLTTPVTRNDLEPCVGLFRVETVWHRLAVLRALTQAVTTELKTQGQRPVRPRWDRRRAEWSGVLALWSSDLGREDPSGLREILNRKELDELGAAFSSWLDAEQERLFEPGKSEADKVERQKSELARRFEVLQEGVSGGPSRPAVPQEPPPPSGP